MTTEMELYASHLEQLREIEMQRNARLLEMIDRVVAATTPKPASPDDERKHLRNYFAASALTGILARRSGMDDAASTAFQYADKMLAEMGK